MKIPEQERLAIISTLEAGAAFGYGNLIGHLQTAWAKMLVDDHGFSERIARKASGGAGYPFLMQADMVERGEWDETGKKYRKER